jgi:hypothetical protein
VLGDVDGLAMPDPRQHLACVVAQVPQADCMRVSGHELNASQFCGYILRPRIGEHV